MYLPYALDRKYPSAHRELKWQYLFASHRLSRDPRTGRIHRHHLHASTFPTHLRRAVERAGILKHVTSHTFRHCFATHLLWSGTDIRQIQQLLGHSDVKTTEIYTHVRNPNEAKVVSPLDRLVRDEVATEGCARAD
ncbi:integron integrase [Rhodopirellula europaea SH398]|uniref:Integron integrase n=1 Tax=Rhodopirellula europaea SH398 TaxID=1263868 RepID=M5S9L8_9BACT|nr:integron integrase [Rhodopirellula europaea SH398]